MSKRKCSADLCLDFQRLLIKFHEPSQQNRPVCGVLRFLCQYIFFTREISSLSQNNRSGCWVIYQLYDYTNHPTEETTGRK